MPQIDIRFACQQRGCGGIIEERLDVAEPDYSAERMSDGDVFEDHEVVCEKCGRSYDVETVSSFGEVTAELRGGARIAARIQHTPDLDDWLAEYEPADNTAGLYYSARDELLALLSKHGSDKYSILNRMIFSQIIAVMEAYLSDKILRLVIDHPGIKERVAAKSGIFKEQTVKLSDVVLNPSLGEATFRLTLQKVLYHDLEKVEKLYTIALEASFFPKDDNVRTALEAAIKLRHDCVHRNGQDIHGALHEFGEAKIRDLAAAVDGLVAQIEASAQKAIDALPF